MPGNGKKHSINKLKECEIKFKVGTIVELEELEKRLFGLGLKKISHQIETDFSPDCDGFPCRKAGILLRFRLIKNKTAKNILITLKVKETKKIFKVCKEIECLFSEGSIKVLDQINRHIQLATGKTLSEEIFNINDFNELQNYLTKQGFIKNRGLIDKRRTIYSDGRLIATFDEFPEQIGTFLELEAKNIKTLRTYLERLKLNQDLAITSDYGEIVRQAKLARGYTEEESRICLFKTSF